MERRLRTGMTGTVLIGYDIEKSFEPAVTLQFVERVIEAQRELQVPATFFILGRCIEASKDALLLLKKEPLFELQQHTYSHIGIKTLWQVKPDGTSRFEPGAPLDAIEDEIKKTNRLLKDSLGVDCQGIAVPRGFYRGLGDRPDLLALFRRNGIHYMRSFSRNEKDWQPVPLDVQPFFYDVQGFPEILEFPVQGWQDCLWYETHGKDKRGYALYLKEMADQTKKRGLTWSFVQHDWSTIVYDPDFSVTKQFILYARDLGISFMTHRDYYNARAAGAVL